jgi:hypothetical protein
MIPRVKKVALTPSLCNISRIRGVTSEGPSSKVSAKTPGRLHCLMTVPAGSVWVPSGAGPGLEKGKLIAGGELGGELGGEEDSHFPNAA